MTPELLSALHSEIAYDEGIKQFVYDDATGKPIVKGTTLQGEPTIGIGRNLAARGLASNEIEFLFDNDMLQCERDLAAAMPWVASLSQNRQVVMYSLYFNMYLGNISKFMTGWPNFLAQMQQGEYAAAADNLETSQPWASEVGSRATRLAEWIRAG